MPLNPFGGTFRRFAQYVLPEAKKQGLAVIGMKSLARQRMRPTADWNSLKQR